MFDFYILLNIYAKPMQNRKFNQCTMLSIIKVFSVKICLLIYEEPILSSCLDVISLHWRPGPPVKAICICCIQNLVWLWPALQEDPWHVLLLCVVASILVCKYILRVHNSWVNTEFWIFFPTSWHDISEIIVTDIFMVNKDNYVI